MNPDKIFIQIFIRASSGSPKSAKSGKSPPAGLIISEIAKHHPKLSDPGVQKPIPGAKKIGIIIFCGLNAFDVAASEYFGILNRSQFLLSESTVQKRSPPLGMRHRKTLLCEDRGGGGASFPSEFRALSGTQDLRLSGPQALRYLWSLVSP